VGDGERAWCQDYDSSLLGTTAVRELERGGPTLRWWQAGRGRGRGRWVEAEKRVTGGECGQRRSERGIRGEHGSGS
jgi:hypothetical protein